MQTLVGRSLRFQGFSLEVSADRSQLGRSVMGIEGAPFPGRGDEEDAV